MFRLFGDKMDQIYHQYLISNIYTNMNIYKYKILTQVKKHSMNQQSVQHF